LLSKFAAAYTLLSSNKYIFSLGAHTATLLAQSTLGPWRLEGFANKTLNLDTITHLIQLYGMAQLLRRIARVSLKSTAQ
jgi:hypothetical protein